MANEKTSITKDEKENLTVVEISTILSNRTKEGRINFAIKKDNETTETQWDIRKAKEIRDMLSEAIEAAVSDTLIYKFFREKIGSSEEIATRAVADMREIRQGTKGVIFPF